MRTSLATLTLGLTLATLPALAAEMARLPDNAPAGNVKAQRVWARMATLKISLDFDDAPVLRVLDHLRQTSRINLVVDGQLRREGELDERRISLEVTDIPFRSALKIVLDFTDLAARWKHGVLLITSPDRAHGATELRLYDVRDITFKMAQFPGPTMELASGSGMDGEGLIFDGEDGDDPTPSNEDIIEFLRDALGEVWDMPRTSLSLLGGQVLVRHTPEVHGQVAEVLALLRAAR